MEIRLTNITKSFGSKQVIAPTTLTVESGSFTTLLGSSGCGKTTLLRMIAGLETPDTGEIWFDDRCIFSKEKKIDTPPEKRGLGFVFQDFALWPHMTVFENVAFGLRAQNRTDGLRDKVMEALRSVHLEELAQRYPHQLSGGQQQRVAFARAIVIEPSCILFDEPLSALDALLPKLRRDRADRGPSWRQTTLLATAITLHNVPEGMAVGLAFALASGGEGLAGAAALAMGIGIQNFPEGAAVALPLRQGGWSRPRAFAGGMLSGAVEPVFGILVVLAAAGVEPLMPWLLSFAAGAMLYVVVEELVPQAHSRAGTCGFVLGFLVMMVLDVALG